MIEIFNVRPNDGDNKHQTSNYEIEIKWKICMGNSRKKAYTWNLQLFEEVSSIYIYIFEYIYIHINTSFFRTTRPFVKTDRVWNDKIALLDICF